MVTSWTIVASKALALLSTLKVRAEDRWEDKSVLSSNLVNSFKPISSYSTL